MLLPNTLTGYYPFQMNVCDSYFMSDGVGACSLVLTRIMLHILVDFVFSLSNAPTDEILIAGKHITFSPKISFQTRLLLLLNRNSSEQNKFLMIVCNSLYNGF